MSKEGEKTVKLLALISTLGNGTSLAPRNDSGCTFKG